MNSNVIFDCERMKYPHTGLYHFCKELGDALLRQKIKNSSLSFYVPKQEIGVFGKDEKYFIQKPLHKFWLKNPTEHNVWHCSFQGTRYLPFKQKNLKIITTAHDLNFLYENKHPLKEKKYLIKLQQLISRSNHIVVISNFVKNQLLEHLNIDAQKISVIYNGTNAPKSTERKKPSGLENKPFFFTIGTILEKKNFHVLPALLLNNDHDLVIAGVTKNEAYKNQIISVAKKLGVEDRVKIIGTVSDSEKYWMFQHCTAFCFPSLAEGFGLPVVEAMQFGTPVILSTATSLPEIGGPHASYFDGMDTESVSKTATKFLSKPITQETRLNLIEWSKQFNWDEAAKQYWQLYSTI